MARPVVLTHSAAGFEHLDAEPLQAGGIGQDVAGGARCSQVKRSVFANSSRSGMRRGARAPEVRRHSSASA